MTILYRLLGINSTVAKDIDHAQFSMSGGIGVRAAIILLVIGLIFFGYIYFKDGRKPTWFVKGPLLALRLLALAALAGMLLQPSLKIQHLDRQKPVVAVLTDTSQSMDRKDSRLPNDRASRITSALGIDPKNTSRSAIMERSANRANVDLLNKISQKYNLRQYNFNALQNLVNLPKSDPKLQAVPDEKQGISTQIGTAIKRALDDTGGQRVAGILVMSDGGNNLGDDPVDVAERARQQGIPVSTMGVGDPTPTRDVAISEVLADQVVRIDGTVQAYVGLSHRGFEGKSVTVTLTRNGETIGSKTVTLGEGGKKLTVPFVYVPRKAGQFTYTATVSELPGEISYENNKRQFLQRVVTKKLKILLVDGEPRWEYRYLRNAVLRDKQIEFSALLSTPGQPKGGEGNVPIDGFPKDEAELFKFDIILLGDIPRSYFSETQLRNLRRFVEDKGSSIIIIAGEKHMPQEYRNSAIQDIMPVVLPPVPEQIKTTEPYQWELTTEGRQDPLLRMSDDPAESLRIWQSLQGMYWNAGVEKAKPGATVLVVNSARANANGKRVVLAVQSFGAGRCLMALSDTTWRWRWRVGDRYFYRFWGQAIRSMTPEEKPGGNRWADISVDRPEHLLGDRVTLHARILDTFFRPVKDRTITAMIQGETGPPTPVVLTGIPGSPGLFSAEVLADRVGKFQVSVVSPSVPDKKGTTNFIVQSLALERQQPEMNEVLLKRIAKAGGGKYYYVDELGKFVDTLKAPDLVVTRESEIELWDAPLFLLCFIIPLALEWFIRKKSGMV